DRLAQVRQRLLGVPQPAPRTMHGDERVLHHLLRGGSVTNQQDRQADERPIMRGVDRRDCPGGIPFSGDRLQGGACQQSVGRHVYGTPSYLIRFTCGHAGIARCFHGHSLTSTIPTPPANESCVARCYDPVHTCRRRYMGDNTYARPCITEACTQTSRRDNDIGREPVMGAICGESAGGAGLPLGLGSPPCLTASSARSWRVTSRRTWSPKAAGR